MAQSFSSRNSNKRVEIEEIRCVSPGGGAEVSQFLGARDPNQ